MTTFEQTPAGAARPERVRVLHLIKGLNVGGAEQLVYLLTRHGDHRRFHYAVAFPLGALDQMSGEFRGSGVPVHDLGGRGQLDLRWLPRLRRLLASERFDVVHLHLPYTAGLGRLAAWSLGPGGRPVVVQTQHDVWQRTRWPTRALSRATWWMDDADFVVSHAVRRSLPPRLARGSEVLHHGIDLQSASAQGDSDSIRQDLGVEPGEVMVVSVANFRRQKGHEVLLAVAATLVAEGLPVRFVAVGHGPLEQMVRDQASAMRLGDRFVIAGLRRDVPAILAAADVFALTSHHEGLPLAVMEALAVGLPAVCTAVGDLPVILRHGIDGLLVQAGDCVGFANALRSVVVDADLRARLTAGAREGSARFDIREASARIEQCYLELLACRGVRPPP